MGTGWSWPSFGSNVHPERPSPSSKSLAWRISPGLLRVRRGLEPALPMDAPQAVDHVAEAILAQRLGLADQVGDPGQDLGRDPCPEHPASGDDLGPGPGLGVSPEVISLTARSVSLASSIACASRQAARLRRRGSARGARRGGPGGRWRGDRARGRGFDRPRRRGGLPACPGFPGSRLPPSGAKDDGRFACVDLRRRLGFRASPRVVVWLDPSASRRDGIGRKFLPRRGRNFLLLGEGKKGFPGPRCKPAAFLGGPRSGRWPAIGAEDPGEVGSASRSCSGARRVRRVDRDLLDDVVGGEAGQGRLDRSGRHPELGGGERLGAPARIPACVPEREQELEQVLVDPLEGLLADHRPDEFWRGVELEADAVVDRPGSGGGVHETPPVPACGMTSHGLYPCGRMSSEGVPWFLQGSSVGGSHHTARSELRAGLGLSAGPSLALCHGLIRRNKRHRRMGRLHAVSGPRRESGPSGNGHSRWIRVSIPQRRRADLANRLAK